MAELRGRQIPLGASSLAPRSAVIAADKAQGREHRQPWAGIIPGPGQGLAGCSRSIAPGLQQRDSHQGAEDSPHG